jgi:hypothetical protein
MLGLLESEEEMVEWIFDLREDEEKVVEDVYVVTGYSESLLLDEAKDYLRRGYQPHGKAVVVVDGLGKRWVQVMIKRKEG